MEAIRKAKLRIGVDPLGGASVAYWQPIAERYGLDIDVVNPRVDPTFAFMTLDHDGKIRMDCSSPYAMAGLVGLKDRYDVAWGNDPDADRHGIVTPSGGLLNPNHYLAVAIAVPARRIAPQWSRDAAVGKTLVSSALIDRVVAGPRPAACSRCRSASSGSRRDSTTAASVSAARRARARPSCGGTARVWTTDKDGLMLGLLAAEITAVTGKDPGVHYRELTAQLGAPHYTRIDAPATPAQKTAFKRLTAERVTARTLAGDAIIAQADPGARRTTRSIGGLKVTTANGWFAARPSGTENVYKLYAESFVSAEHLARIVAEAQRIVGDALAA